MQLPPEDKGSPDPHGVRPKLSSDQLSGLDDEDLLRTAPFPLYGIIGHPRGLTLKGTGYSTAFGHFDTPQGPWQADQPVLWQVSLGYDYPPASRRTGHTLELSTTDIRRAPMQASVLDADEMSDRLRYLVPQDVPEVRAEATRFIVEHWPIIDGVVLATMDYAPNSFLTFTLTHAVRLSMWSFTLWNPPLWVEGRAFEWTQSDLFSALGKLAMVSQRPDVLRQYQREQQAWDHYMRSTTSKREL